MTEREDLLKRLERVKALAERGVGGGKENAEALLKRLMDKYDISDEDIEDTSTIPRQGPTSSDIRRSGSESCSTRLHTCILGPGIRLAVWEPTQIGHARKSA